MKFLHSTGSVTFVVFLCHLFGVLTGGHPLDTLNRLSDGHAAEQIRTILSVNNDELLIAEVAINHRKGLSYMSSQESHRAGRMYDFTAYRPSYPVYLHLALITFYEEVFPGKPVQWLRTDNYFIGYAFILQVISILLFYFSLRYFRQIALAFLPPAWANAALLLYGLHPSVSFCIGNLVNYESIVTSILIIHVWLLMKVRKSKLTAFETIMLVGGFLIAVLFRPQLNFIYLFLFGLFFLLSFINRKADKGTFLWCRNLVLACTFLYISANIPVLVKNYRLFNSPTLSTTGFNFSLGHNPYARGGWCGDCFVNPSSPYYKYIRDHIPGYDAMDEFQKASHLQKLGMSWILENPLQEIILAARKTAIYFLPYNNDDTRFNVMNLVFHLGTVIFILWIALLLIVKRDYNPDFWLLSMPLAGSLLVTILFHVGYRWRYYAEPFMVIMTLVVAYFLFQHLQRKRT